MHPDHDSLATVAPPLVRRVAAVGVALAAGLALPVLVHLIPVQAGPPAGARLLPIFLAPLVAALRLDAVSSLAIALLSPLANHLLTGMPAGPLLATIIVELVVFMLLLLALRRTLPRLAGPAAPLAYLVAASAAALLVPPAASPLATLAFAFGSSWPGLVLLLAVGFLARPARPDRPTNSARAAKESR